MRTVLILLAFVCGFLLPPTIGRIAVHVTAQGQDEGGTIHVCVDKAGVLRNASLTTPCPFGQRSFPIKKADSTVDFDVPKEKEKKNEDKSAIDKAILDDLNRRLNKLENEECASIGKNRVVAPFEVFDRSGKKVFSVVDGAVGLFDSSGKPVARMSANRANGDRGLFVADGGNNTVFFGISDTVVGFGMRAHNQLRIELGKNPQLGNYRLRVLSASGGTLAAIGVSPENNSGLATVGDQSGKTKATVGLTKNGAGLLEIIGANAIAQLTEAEVHHGGKLWIGNASGVGMVEAGDAGGYGMVRAGPLGFEFIPTPGLALPGSVIIGKR